MEIINFLTGLVLGGLVSAVAGAWLQPLFEEWTGYHVIRAFFWIFEKTRRQGVLSGEWNQCWVAQQSSNFPVQNGSTLTIKQFGGYIAGEYDVISKTGEHYKYRLYGRMNRNHITGAWQDCQSLGYFGTFKMRVHESRTIAEGMWIGSRHNQTVSSGNWEWTR